METIRSTGSHSQDHIRVSHTLPQKTSSNSFKDITKTLRGSVLCRNEHGHRQDEKTGRSRKSTSISKLPIVNFLGSQERRLCSAHFQSAGPQSFCDNRQVQAFECFSCARLSATKRLALQNRPITGILSCERCSQPQTILTSNLSKAAMGNDLLTIWPKYCSQNICYSDKLDCPNTQKTRNSNPGIFGRLLNRSSARGSLKTPRPISYSHSRDTRVDGQLRQVSTNSFKEFSLPGCPMESLGKSEAAFQRKGTCADCQALSNVRQRTHRSERDSQPCGAPKFCKFHCYKRSTQLSSPVEPTQQNVEIRSEMAFHPARSQDRCKMVASKLQTPFKHSYGPSVSLPHDGCLGHCMGSSARQLFANRSLVKSREELALQPEGNASHSKGFARSLSAPEPEHNFGSMRQQNCDRIPSSRGRYKVSATHGLDIPSISDTGRVSDSCEYFSHTRNIQWSRRPSVETSTRSRMASFRQMHKKSVCQMGNTSNRPFCVQSSPCSGEVCISGSERPPCIIPRRVLSSVELPSRVDIPSTIPDTQSAMSPKQGSGDLPLGSTTLASSLLASRSKEPSISSPLHPSKSRSSPDRCHDRSSPFEGLGHDPRGVEMWGWTDNLKEWNDNQLKLLEKSWRASTRKTYDVAWKKWLVWSEQHHISSHNPSGGEVARFLSDLHLVHKLSYSTIILHKSVISTLCNPDNAGQISSHILVKQVLKSIALDKPVQTKPPVWNIDSLASYLSRYDVQHDNIFHVQRHAATLLLLCSGRRIHDLTLLRTDTDHYIQTDGSVTLWPAFGSKTDSSDYRQSGWRFFPNLDNRNLDPVYWITRLVDLLVDRRNSAEIYNMFVSVRGEPKAASKTVISGWIKTLFKDAGITATPGSIRSAVASKNWVDNFPMEDILSRGNWRSQNTFCKFYRRPVLPVSSSTSVTRFFNPVN